VYNAGRFKIIVEKKETTVLKPQLHKKASEICK